ncbi:MAG TPA: hypothetical protein VGC85_05450 [Chthoniobacterales bacterium]|jgi:hypothetical protein
MNRFSKLLAFVSLVLLVAVAPLSARPRATRSKPGKTQESHTTVITSVTPTALTIQEDQVTKSFMITPFTEVNVNGQRATVADLKPGMSVSVTLGSDASKLSRIAAGPAPVSDGGTTR